MKTILKNTALILLLIAFTILVVLFLYNINNNNLYSKNELKNIKAKLENTKNYSIEMIDIEGSSSFTLLSNGDTIYRELETLNNVHSKVWEYTNKNEIIIVDNNKKTISNHSGSLTNNPMSFLTNIDNKDNYRYLKDITCDGKNCAIIEYPYESQIWIDKESKEIVKVISYTYHSEILTAITEVRFNNVSAGDIEVFDSNNYPEYTIK